MSTSEPVELRVTLRALDALGAAGGTPTADHARAVAAPVVAAELRRLAADVRATAAGLAVEPGSTATAEADTLVGVARTLDSRADELDPR